VRCVLPSDAHEAARRLSRVHASVIFERLPAALWSELAPSPVSDRLSRGVKDRFDPSHVLNPGLLGEDFAS
jgi:FAD/FMN-containing dehydrogenase